MSSDNALTVRDDDYEPDPAGGRTDPLAVWQEQRAQAATSLNVETDQGAMTYLRCLRNADLKAKQCTADTMNVQDWFVHVVKPIVNQDGEIGSSLRLVFVLADGRTVATRSPAVLDCWRHTVKLAGLRGWKFPLRVKLRAVPVGEGREYLEIESVGPQPTSAVSKSK